MQPEQVQPYRMNLYQLAPAKPRPGQCTAKSTEKLQRFVLRLQMLSQQAAVLPQQQGLDTGCLAEVGAELLAA